MLGLGVWGWFRVYGAQGWELWVWAGLVCRVDLRAQSRSQLLAASCRLRAEGLGVQGFKKFKKDTYMFILTSPDMRGSRMGCRSSHKSG